MVVANPFGRPAMQQGEPSRVVVSAGKPLTLRFTAIIHEGDAYDAAVEAAAVSPSQERAANE